MNKLDLADFTFVRNDDGEVTVTKDGKKILQFSGPNTNKNINAIIVGLLAVNPGPNPPFVTRSMIADHYGKSTRAVDHWQKIGNLPAVIEIHSRDSEQRVRDPMTAIPLALIGEITIRPQGNPTFSTPANPTYKRRTNGVLKTR